MQKELARKSHFAPAAPTHNVQVRGKAYPSARFLKISFTLSRAFASKLGCLHIQLRIFGLCVFVCACVCMCVCVFVCV